MFDNLVDFGKGLFGSTPMSGINPGAFNLGKSFDQNLFGLPSGIGDMGSGLFDMASSGLGTAYDFYKSNPEDIKGLMDFGSKIYGAKMQSDILDIYKDRNQSYLDQIARSNLRQDTADANLAQAFEKSNYYNI